MTPTAHFDLIQWIQANWGALATFLLAIHWILGTVSEMTGNKTVDGIDAVIANILKAVFQKDTTLPSATPPKQ